MILTDTSSRRVASIANQFVQNARYKLSPREQKLILHMATLIRPDDSDFETYLVPVTEIEHILKTDQSKKHGSFYERLDDLLDSITDKKISFPTNFMLEGRRLRGHINWVSGAVPKVNEHGTLCVEFGFSAQMKPFLLGLKERFTQFELYEVASMKSGHSIRIFQICKSYYLENARHGRNTITVSILELKERLGIEDKYPDFRNFRRKVLDVAKKEINQNTTLTIDYEYIRESRKITSVKILITDEKDKKQLASNVSSMGDKLSSSQRKRLARLTYAQTRAYNKLTNYRVHTKVILDEVLPIIKGSELVGYEDHFVRYMLTFFEQKTNKEGEEEKVKALVGWIRNKRFEEPNLFARITEYVIAQKKSMDIDTFENRELAKTMSFVEFQKLKEAEKTKASILESTVEKATAEYTKPKATTTIKEEVSSFDFKAFQKQYSKVFARLRAKQEAQNAAMEGTKAFKQLVENGTRRDCELWFNENVG